MSDLERDPLADYDRLGRKQPTRMSFAHFVRGIPGLGARIRKVPSRAVVEEGVDEDGEHALVECPCSRRPIVRETLGECEGCERFYIYLGGEVFVAYGDMQVPSAPAATVGTTR